MRRRRITSLILSVLILCAVLSCSVMRTVYGASDAEGSGGGYVASGQVEGAGYSARLYDSSNGLLTSDANCILGSRSGYVYIGSYSGIFRYDGSVFSRLSEPSGMTSGRGLFEDESGRIWVGTNDNGVFVLDGQDSFHFGYEEGMPSLSIRTFAQDGSGNVYIGTTAGVCYVDPEMRFHLIDDERLNSERVLKLDSDPNGVVYGQTTNGCIFSVEDGEVKAVYGSEELGVEKITTILADPYEAGMVYLGTQEDKVYYGHFGDSKDDLTLIDTAPLTNIHWMSFDCGRVWISSTTSIGYLDDGNVFRELTGLPMQSSIEMMTSDYQGNMWFTSSTQGVMKIVADNFTDLYETAGLEDTVVYATCIYGDRLYVGTAEGLAIFDGDLNPVEDDPLIDYIGGSRVRAIGEDPDGNLWIGTFTDGKGLLCVSPDGRITSYTTGNGLQSNEIRCISFASDGSVLAGGNGGLTIIRDGVITGQVGAEDGIENTVFHTVTEGTDGQILIGTDGDGLYIYDEGQITRLGRDDGLTSDVITRITYDREHDLYFIITSNSIEFLKDGRITSVSTLPYNNYYDIYPDDEENYWILSSFGIYVVDQNDLISDNVSRYRLYTLSNGLPGIPTLNSYSFLDEDGTLYIAGREGVSIVNINNYRSFNEQVILDVSAVFCDDALIRPNEEGEYVIGSDVSRIRIVPAVLDYTLTDPSVRIFMDDTSDGITTKASDMTYLEYTGLSYGTYTLHIQLIDDMNGRVLNEASFTFVKQPHFFELRSVRLLAAVFLLVLTGFIVWRVLKGTIIRRQYRQIRQANEDVKKANSVKARFLANMSHEIRTPINTIMGMNEMILREDSTDVPKGYFMSIVNYALDIRRASELLLENVNDLLDISSIESGNIQLANHNYYFEELLRSVVRISRVRASERHVDLFVDADEMTPNCLTGDYGKIRQILLSVLNAVIKDAGGDVRLSTLVKETTGEECTIRFTVSADNTVLDSVIVSRETEEDLDTLQLSRRFIDVLGGSLDYDKESGSIVFTVKQKIADNAPIGSFNEAEEDTVAGPYIPKFIAPEAEVLIVDDNPMIINVLTNLLKATKMFISTAGSGEECYERIKSGTFDVVLLDHTLPGMDAMETIARIREVRSDLPVYLLTANATADDNYYHQAGFTGYLVKPVNSVALESAILKCLPGKIVEVSETESQTPDDIPEDHKWINDVDEINVTDGIRNSGGVTSFIGSLDVFRKTIDENSEAVVTAFGSGDMNLFTVKMRMIKTSARIIGANELCAHASGLEEAGLRNDGEYIKHNLPEFIEEYRSFKEILKDV